MISSASTVPLFRAALIQLLSRAIWNINSVRHGLILLQCRWVDRLLFVDFLLLNEEHLLIVCRIMRGAWIYSSNSFWFQCGIYLKCKYMFSIELDAFLIALRRNASKLHIISLHLWCWTVKDVKILFMSLWF